MEIRDAASEIDRAATTAALKEIMTPQTDRLRAVAAELKEAK